MPRRPRRDEPGAWHHVFNRGLAKRPLFQSAADHRHFLACVARAVRRGHLEVHKFTLVLNHFHMLARSPIGRLDAAMHDIQMCYARRVNRRLRRDGPLFRNRYNSRRVTSAAYRRRLVSYIDANPVAAGLVARPEDHPWSCAGRYAAARRPPWLTTSWIDAQVAAQRGRGARDVSAYRQAFPLRVDPGFLAWVERRFRAADGARDDLDLALGPDPAQTLAWMRRQAELADGEEDSLPLAEPDAVLAALRDRSTATTALKGLKLAPGPIIMPGDLLAAGLLRDAAVLTWAEIAGWTRSPARTARTRWLAHRRRILHDPEYAAHATEIVRAAARSTAGFPASEAPVARP
jgi:REP element-mobilizing transposase RayT